jgi:hypothetical protein
LRESESDRDGSGTAEAGINVEAQLDAAALDPA